DLFVARRSSLNDSFAGGTLLGELRSIGEDLSPVVRDDELEIFFSSSRTGTQRIWRAVREATADPWGEPTPIDIAADGPENGPSWLSSDGCRLYFHSNRTDGAGQHDIWFAMRGP